MRLASLRPVLTGLVAFALSGSALHAMPSQQQDVLRGRISVKEVAAGWVGVGFDSVDAGDSTRIVVTAVYPESPAARAGLRTGDRVLRVNGTRVSFPIIQSLGPRIQPGDPYTFAVLRRGELLEFPVVAEARPVSSEIIVKSVQSQLDTLRTLMGVALDSLESVARLPELHLRSQTSEDGSVTLFVSADAEGTGVEGAITLRATAELADDPAQFSRAYVLTDTTRVYELFDREVVTISEAAPGAMVRAPGEISTWTTSPLDAYAEGARRVAGAELHRVSDDLGRYLGVDRGLLVTEVAPGTPAARTGLRSGDVVLRVNGIRVESLEAMRKLLSVPTERRVLEIYRKGERLEFDYRR